MKGFITAGLLFFCGIAQGQADNRKGYASAEVSAYGVDGNTQAGVFASGNGQVLPGLYLGASIGYYALPNAKYIPLQGRVTLLGDGRYIQPMAIWAPGIGFQDGSSSFTFYTGAGIAANTSAKLKPFAMVGYDYLRQQMKVRTYTDFVSLRVGLMIF